MCCAGCRCQTVLALARAAGAAGAVRLHAIGKCTSSVFGGLREGSSERAKGLRNSPNRLRGQQNPYLQPLAVERVHPECVARQVAHSVGLLLRSPHPDDLQLAADAFRKQQTLGDGRSVPIRASVGEVVWAKFPGAAAAARPRANAGGRGEGGHGAECWAHPLARGRMRGRLKGRGVVRCRVAGACAVRESACDRDRAYGCTLKRRARCTPRCAR